MVGYVRVENSGYGFFVYDIIAKYVINQRCSATSDPRRLGDGRE